MSSWVLTDNGQFVMLDEPGVHAVITECAPNRRSTAVEIANPFEVEFTRRGRTTRLAYRPTLEGAMLNAEVNARHVDKSPSVA